MIFAQIQNIFGLAARYWYIVIILLFLGVGLEEVIINLPNIIKYGKLLALI